MNTVVWFTLQRLVLLDCHCNCKCGYNLILLSLKKNTAKQVTGNTGGSKGAPGKPLPSWSNFFYFPAVFGNLIETEGLATPNPSGKSWIRH